MKITISSSSCEDIDNSYIEKSRILLNYLVNNLDVELLWGACSTSIMGLCYQIFKDNNKKIYGYTTKKYINDLDNLTYATHKIFDNTYDLKKNLFYDADIIICLPGGLGTISEFFSFLEEIRSNDVNKLLIIYDIDKHFSKTISLLDELIKHNFTSINVYNYFKIVDNIDDLSNILKENGYL